MSNMQIGEFLAGDSIALAVTFPFPAEQHLDGIVVRWALLNQEGLIFGQGDAVDVQVEGSSFVFQVSASASISLPSDLPTSTNDTQYKVRWELTADGITEPFYNYETIRVVSITTVPEGPEQSVEMENDPISVGIVLDKIYSAVGFEIYAGNTRLVPYTAVSAPPVKVSTGQYYTQSLDPFNLPSGSTGLLTANLDPYLVAWKYWNSSAPTLVRRESTRVVVLNGSLMNVLDDVKAMVMKAKATLFGFPDTLFDPPTIVTWLRRARDLFNGAGGYPTTFTMLNATGAIREYWIRYAEVSMLRAQALAEGEKAFNFTGQAISLDVDRTQYYSSLADTLQQQLDNEIKPYKANLIKKGLTGGDGDASMLSQNASARVGIMITPASNIGWRGSYIPR